jgi:hypothetical protein
MKGFGSQSKRAVLLWVVGDGRETEIGGEAHGRLQEALSTGWWMVEFEEYVPVIIWPSSSTWKASSMPRELVHKSWMLWWFAWKAMVAPLSMDTLCSGVAC